MRTIWERAQQGDERARLGLDMLSYRIAWYINALRTAAPRTRAVVFTAGIGEHAWYVRQAVCQILGLTVDDEKNKRHALRISPDGAPVDVFVIPTNEQLQMHRLAKNTL